MTYHKILTHDTILELLPSINPDKDLLFYSYLTQRKEKALFFCQFVGNNLTAILAYYSELSFPAFSFILLEEKNIYFQELVKFTRETLKLNPNAVCGTILSKQHLKHFHSHGLITGNPQRFFTMKHQDESKLLEAHLTEKIRKDEYSAVIDFIHKGGMRFFTKSELENCPFLGVKEGEDFVSVGGYHFYDIKLVELGNIVTRDDRRGRGLAKHVTSELTHLGKKVSSDVYLGVLADNLSAVRVYESLGYVITADLFMVDFTLNKTLLSCY